MVRFYTNDYDDDMLVSGEEAVRLVDETTLLVIVDVNKGEHTECPELIELAQSIVVIDHHRQAGDAIAKAVLFYIEPYASSASEMVAEICQYIGGGLKLRAAEAEALYAGVMIDTNYFTDKTGVRTFEAMAYLKRNGADSVRIRKMFREDINEYKIQAEAIQNTELYLDHYAITESESRGVETPTVLGAKIANSLLNIEQVKASFVLTKYNVLGSLGVLGSGLDVHALHVFFALCNVAFGDHAGLNALFVSFFDDLIVHIREVGYIVHFISLVFHVTAHGIKYDHRAGISDMDQVVYGRSADIHFYLAGL